jgi:peptidoglycan/xylan/chitin deacetylase (PgdA/CDA1 family)
MRAAGRAVLGSVPVDRALRLLESADHGARDVLGVLTYHRIAAEGGVDGSPGLVSASPEHLADQMSYVARRFRPVALEEVLAAGQGRRPLPHRAVLVTFDDAYRDFADHAWPVLRRAGIPTTLFVPTAFPDHPERWAWWDWLHAAVAAAPEGASIPIAGGERRIPRRDQRDTFLGELRAALKRQPHEELLAMVAAVGDRLGVRPAPNAMLSWDALRSLAADGVTLAPHSRTHPLLDRIDSATLDDELIGAIADLEREVGPVPRALAYPSGSASPAVRAATARAGYELAFTTRRGLNRLGQTDWLMLNRINVGRATSVSTLRAQLGRWALAWSP